MKKVMFLCCIQLLLSNLVFGGVLQLRGYYSGKNLFIENDFITDANHHCITNVYVNSKHLLDHPIESIAEVNLSAFKVGDTLDIRIYHKDGCMPKLINKHDIEPNTNHFTFLKINVTETTIHWETKGEETIGKYSVEQLMYGEWSVIRNVKAQGTTTANSYNTANHTFCGDNKYRIKYKAAGGLVVISDEFFFHSTKTPVVFYPKRVVDFITFESDNNREVEYTVLDNVGSVLFEGKAFLIDCRNLPASKYYKIRYENKEEHFYKKGAGEQ